MHLFVFLVFTRRLYALDELKRITKDKIDWK